MLTFVAGYIFVYMAQFALYHAQTVANELRGADGNLVFVSNPVLIINLDQGIQDVFRFPDGDVIDAEVDDSGIFVTQFSDQCICISIGGGTHASPDIPDRGAYKSVGKLWGRGYDHGSGRGLYGVAHLGGECFPCVFSRYFEFGNGKRFS